MIIANKNNPLGLIRDKNATYRLVAYFYYNNLGEIAAESVNGIAINTSQFTWQAEAEPATINEDKWKLWHSLRRQIKHYFPTTEKRYIARYIGFGYCFLFEKYEEMLPISMQGNISKNFEQAGLDYFINNNELPLLISELTLYNNIQNLDERKRKSEKYRPLTLKDLRRIMADPRTDNRNYENKPVGDVIRETPDYNEILQESMQLSALLKGGYYEWKERDNLYFLPLLPLIALTDENCDGEEYTINRHTWFFEQKGKDKFETIINDIFIIANIDIHLKESTSFLNYLIFESKKIRQELLCKN